MNNLFKKNYSYNYLIEFFILFILLIFPKFNIIDLTGYHQGIRIEDSILVSIFLQSRISQEKNKTTVEDFIELIPKTLNLIKK